MCWRRFESWSALDSSDGGERVALAEEDDVVGLEQRTEPVR
jgi:hypothetical protein